MVREKEREEEAQRQRDSMDAPASDIDVRSGVNSEEKFDESEKRVAPDLFDERYCTTKKEIYAYYWCVEC